MKSRLKEVDRLMTNKLDKAVIIDDDADVLCAVVRDLGVDNVGMMLPEMI